MTELLKQQDRWLLNGAFDRFSLETVWHELNSFAGAKQIIIDLTQLGRVDSAGLAGFVQLRVQAEQQQVALNFENVPKQLCHLAQLFNVDALLAFSCQRSQSEI